MTALLLAFAHSTTAQTGLPKILCLHGGGESAADFSSQSGMAALQSSLGSSYEFVFAQGPEAGNLWIRDPPGGKDNPTTATNWASSSVTYLNGLVQNQGPFYGILGYSQ